MVNEGPQRPDTLLEMDIRFRRFARDRICVLQRLAQFQVVETDVALGAKSFLTRNPNSEARPPRALLDAPRVQPSDARWPGEASESFRSGRCFPRWRGKRRPRRARSPVRLRISDLSVRVDFQNALRS